jgi:hypothetical protein
MRIRPAHLNRTEVPDPLKFPCRHDLTRQSDRRTPGVAAMRATLRIERLGSEPSESSLYFGFLRVVWQCQSQARDTSAARRDVILLHWLFDERGTSPNADRACVVARLLCRKCGSAGSTTSRELTAWHFTNMGEKCALVRLLTGEIVMSVSTVNLTVFQGGDGNPGSHLSGGSPILASVVSQRGRRLGCRRYLYVLHHGQ